MTKIRPSCVCVCSNHSCASVIPRTPDQGWKYCRDPVPCIPGGLELRRNVLCGGDPTAWASLGFQLLGLRFPLLLTLPLAGGVARDPGGDPRSSSHVSQVGSGSEGCLGPARSGSAEPTAAPSLPPTPEVSGGVGAGVGSLCGCEV